MKHLDAASIASRALAAAVDGCIASTFFWCLWQLEVPFVGLEWLLFLFGGLIAGAVASSALFPAQSPGKALARVVVLSIGAGTLSWARQTARDVLHLGVIFAGCISYAAGGIVSLTQAFVMAAASTIAIEMSVQSVRTDRRSIADLLFDTRVVRLPPLQPHRAPAVPMYSADDAEFGNPPRAPGHDA